MLFTEEFISKIDEDPIHAILEACVITLGSLSDEYLSEEWYEEEWYEDELNNLMEGAGLIDAIVESNDFIPVAALPELEGSMRDVCHKLFNYVPTTRDAYYSQSNEIKLSSHKNRYLSLLKTSFAYEFSQGDFDRIQVLINELRSHITENKSFEERHRQRLLKRLEKLQSELHKRVSDLDKFWGMIGDAGVALGKFGEDSKPIVDRIKEITEIVWKTQARTEELPSSTPGPLIGHGKDT